MNNSRIAIEAMDLLLRADARVLGTRVDDWLTTDDPEVLSVVYLAISRAQGRIDGGVAPRSYFKLVAKLVRVLPEQPGDSGYSLGSYDAASIYAAFLRQCATDENMPDPGDLLRMAVADLAEAYRQADAKQRRCIVDAALEHAFSEPAVRAAFFQLAARSRLRRCLLRSGRVGAGLKSLSRNVVDNVIAIRASVTVRRYAAGTENFTGLCLRVRILMRLSTCSALLVGSPLCVHWRNQGNVYTAAVRIQHGSAAECCAAA